MSATNKLLHNTLIYSIGSLGSKVMSFALVPLFSFFLTKSELGHYDLILTTLSLFVPIVTLQISEASYRWLLDAKGDHDAQKTAISNGLFVLLISLLLSLAIYAVLRTFIHFDHSAYFLSILFLASLLPFAQQLLRGLGDSRSYSFSGILNTVFLFIFSVSFLYFFKLGLEGLLLATLLSYAITILFIVKKCNLLKYLSAACITSASIREMLRYSWPLIPNAVSWWMISASNRYIILLVLGTDHNGIFAIANRFPSIILIVNSIFMLAWQDHVIGNDDPKNLEINTKIFDKYMRLQFGMVIVLTSVSRYVAEYLIDPKFYDAWRYMPLLYLGVVFSSFCAFLGTAYIKQKKTTSIFYTTILGGAINVVVSYLLIPVWGLYGPALGTLIGFVVVWIVRVYQTRLFFPVTIDYGIFSILIAANMLCIGLTAVDNTLINYALIPFSITVAILVNKEIFKVIIDTVKAKIQKPSNKEYHTI